MLSDCSDCVFGVQSALLWKLQITVCMFHTVTSMIQKCLSVSLMLYLS